MYVVDATASCTRAEIVELLRSERIDSLSAAELAPYESFVTELTGRAYRDGDELAEAEIHKLLFAINVATLEPPWECPINNARGEFFVRIRGIIERAWDAYDRRRFAEQLAGVPPVEQFADWATARIQAHAGNVDHELFSFLRDRATRAQLTEFQLQETPFDIYFGDIIALMLPGVYGPLKMELVSNYFDEMGCGDVGMVHRSLRLHMMTQIGIDHDIVKKDLDVFCLPQLRLANMYFDAVLNREKLYQAIGMLLATELMVPGRLEYQIEGWKRTGLADESMQYLQLHTLVDITHAEGWMRNVVVPLLAQDPAAMKPMTLGMYRRLVYAADVCDYMLADLRRNHA
jgi:pyrroloquinoline quinone (PQQ) biosynthesis protein C